MNNTTLNIDNLTSLWKDAASYYNGNMSNAYYESAYIKSSAWPNKVWAKGSAPLLSFEKAKSELENITSGLTYVHFYPITDEGSTTPLANFQLKSVQYGMSLPLNTPFNATKRLSLTRVNEQGAAILWSNSFEKAFGYNISPDTLLKSHETIPYYLIYFQGSLIGTAILWQTGKVAGIHSLGILPEHRKKGFATEAMYQVLNEAMAHNASLAVLQASEMAKGLYAKMGFSLDFMMENYRQGG